MSLLLPMVIFAFAAFAQAVTGFGFALVAVPLLTLVVDPRAAVVASTLVCLAQTSSAVARHRRDVHWPAAVRLLAAALLGMPFGLLVLRYAPAPVLAVVIAAVSLACTVLVAAKLRLPATPPYVLAAGALCGVLATSTGTNGPPLVAALQSMSFTPPRFRATLAVVFTACAAVSLTGFTATGLLTPTPLLLAASALPVTRLAAHLGDRLTPHINPTLFHRLVLTTLTAGTCAALANTHP
ncbi:hypothetical protein GCM10027589_32740 [Actinocorallia lasiicapitis]